MKIAIVKSNGIVDKRIERVLVSNKIKAFLMGHKKIKVQKS